MKRYLMASCLALAWALLPGGCVASDTGARPAVEIKVVERVVEVQRPCSATVPIRPAPLAKPLPTDAIALSALLGAKLQEYAGDGAFADKALASLAICTKPTP